MELRTYLVEFKVVFNDGSDQKASAKAHDCMSADVARAKIRQSMKHRFGGAYNNCEFSSVMPEKKKNKLDFLNDILNGLGP